MPLPSMPELPMTRRSFSAAQENTCKHTHSFIGQRTHDTMMMTSPEDHVQTYFLVSEPFHDKRDTSRRQRVHVRVLCVCKHDQSVDDLHERAA
jgi:hypothetical protein